MISCKIILATQKGCIGLLYLCTRNPTEVWVSGRYQHIANVPSRKAPKVRILLLPQIGGLAELVYCTGLENQRAVKRPKGSNPLASSKGTLADLVYAQD